MPSVFAALQILLKRLNLSRSIDAEKHLFTTIDSEKVCRILVMQECSLLKTSGVPWTIRDPRTRTCNPNPIWVMGYILLNGGGSGLGSRKQVGLGMG